MSVVWSVEVDKRACEWCVWYKWMKKDVNKDEVVCLWVCMRRACGCAWRCARDVHEVCAKDVYKECVHEMCMGRA